MSRTRSIVDARWLDQLADELVEQMAVTLVERIDARVEQLLIERTAAQPRAVDVRTAAARLNVSARTVAQMIASGQLRSVRVGRRRLIPLAALEAMLGDAA